MAHQPEWYENRQAVRRDRFADRGCSDALLNQALDDADLAIADMKLYMTRARQAEQHMRELERTLGATRRDLASANREKENRGAEIGRLNKRIAAIGKFLGGVTFTGTSKSDDKLVQDLINE